MVDLASLRERFRDTFGGSARVFRVPGRVNLIGGHVDYNEGWVFPIAIDRYCYALARPRDDARLRICSEQFHETVEVALDEPRRGRHHWSDYVRGVAWALRQTQFAVGGANLLISSEVPLGSGLSSSAALEVAAAFALLGIHYLELDRTELARLCQRAENEYVGMRCGIMDQLAACFGKENQALLIDCRKLTVEPVPLDPAQVRVVVANTMVKHALAASEYNTRRRECEEAVRLLRAHGPEVRALRDVTWAEVEPLATAWPENIRRRARHVTTEIARVHEAVAALRAGNYREVGRLMAESHASLDQDYQVSSAELNTMFALAQDLPGFYGARMTGGGFGGCTVNLVAADRAEAFAAALAQRYEEKTSMCPDVYLCRAAAGAEEII